MNIIPKPKINKKMTNRASIFSILIFFGFPVVLVFCSLAVVAENNSNEHNVLSTNEKLQQIQNQLEKQKILLQKTTVKISDIEEQLKRDDITLGEVSKKLVALEQQVIKTENKSKDIAKKITQLTLQKQRQEVALAKQLRAAYSTGDYEYIKLILNQKKPATVQRTISHYQYLNKARINEIESFKAKIQQLNSLTSQYQIALEKLKQLQDKQYQQKQIVSLSKVKQRQTLKALESRKISNIEKINKLKKQENAIVSLLKKMAALALKKAEKLNGLSQLKRQLKWPVKGKITHRFGSKKHGYLKWKGVMLSAPSGRSVNAIYSGTVLFSDWLKGYGLVSVIDHGDGYMSLYGHNQSLLKSVGDRVEAGETIALIGQSGGLSNPGLYFEIRNAGKAVNPKLWCR